MANKAQAGIVFSKDSEALSERKLLFGGATTLHYVTPSKKLSAYPCSHRRGEERAFQGQTQFVLKQETC